MKALLALLFTFSLLVIGCKKEPGEGGRAEIQGVLYEQRYNGTTDLPIGNAYPLSDARVSIIYGDGDYPDNDTRTSPEGRFHFPWLRKGDYRIYVISECNAYNNCTVGIYTDVEISGRKDVVVIDTILVRNY
ncbi:MAG: hypothetical protein IPI81_06295 [Flavobacteriales bacterium]|nr:hypothetical protein [Flavobacteriales bacterium]MCC6937236.1 hypothetical protein [Flavobacteriales bacterium]